MHRNITNSLIQTYGIDISKYDDLFLQKSLEKRMVDTGCGSLAEYCEFLEHSPGESASLVDAIQICYSEFFRNQLTFAVLERIILPSIVLKKKKTRSKEIRIWSAACAGGQEAYSLAMLLEELRKGEPDPFTYRIFATDQSEFQVIEAKKGHYTAAALNNVSLRRTAEWFNRKGDVYSVKPELKKHIDFSVFDLFNTELCCPPECIFGDFDLIFCANFLFYYKNEFQKRVLKKARSSLACDGYLVTGEAERDILMKRNFHEVYSQSAIFQA